MNEQESFQRALREGLEGVARSLERIRDELHQLELGHIRDDTEVRALVSNTRQWISSISSVVKGSGSNEPLQQQLAMVRHRLDTLEAGGQANANAKAAKVDAKAKITVQLIMSVAGFLTAVGAAIIAFMK